MAVSVFSGVAGGKTVVATGGGLALDGCYAIVPAALVAPSVEIALLFGLPVVRGRGPRFGVENPRAYVGRRGMLAAKLLARRCQGFDPMLLLDPTRQAASGPPTVVRRVAAGVEAFVVVAGNGRAAMVKAVAAAHVLVSGSGVQLDGCVRELAPRWEAYVNSLGDELARCAALFRLPLDAVCQPGGPWMLVRVIDEHPCGKEPIDAERLTRFTSESDQSLATAYDLVALAEVRRERLAEHKGCRSTLVEALRVAFGAAVGASQEDGSGQMSLLDVAAPSTRKRRARAVGAGSVLQRWLSSDSAVCWFEALCTAGVIVAESAPLFIDPHTTRLTLFARLQLTHLIIALVLGDVGLLERYEDADVVSRLGYALPELINWSHTRAHERWRYFFRLALEEDLSARTSTAGVGIQQDIEMRSLIAAINGVDIVAGEEDCSTEAGVEVAVFFLRQLRNRKVPLAERLELVGQRLDEFLENTSAIDDVVLLRRMTQAEGGRLVGSGGVRLGTPDAAVRGEIARLSGLSRAAAREEVLKLVTDAQWAVIGKQIVRPVSGERKTTDGSGRPRVDDRFVLSAFMWLRRRQRVSIRQISTYWKPLRAALNRSVTGGGQTTTLASAETMRTMLQHWRSDPKKWEVVCTTLDLTEIQPAIAERDTTPAESVGHDAISSMASPAGKT